MKMVMVFRVPSFVRLAALSVAVSFACTPTSPPAESKRKDGIIQVQPAPTPPKRIPEKAPNWRWDILEEGQSLRPDASWSQRSFGTWFPIDMTGNHINHVQLDYENGDTHVRAFRTAGLASEKLVWQVDFPGEVAVGAARNVVGPHRPYIAVVHHSPIASGARLTMLNGYNGAAMWEVDLEGLGPVDHSKYRNEVQLELHRKRVVVYGRESQGRYVEVRTTTGGHPVAHALIGDDGPMEIPPGDSRRDDHPKDGCEITEQLSTNDYSYALSYCYISSGATLTRYAPGTNDELWKVQLRGLGSVHHSEYFSNYKLDIHEGNPMVVGWEEAGSFLEIRDAETGEELWSIVKRD